LSYEITNSSSIEELKSLLNFINLLVIKDETKAESYETIESAKFGYSLIAAQLKLDTDKQESMTDLEYEKYRTNFINSFEGDFIINDPGLSPLSFFTEVFLKNNDDSFNITKMKLILTNRNISYTDEDSETILKKKILESNPKTLEQNKYYLDLKSTYGITYFNARYAKDFYIIYYPTNYLNSYETNLFLETYYKNFKYFMTVLYNKSFESYTYYKNFVRFLLVIMTAERFLNLKLDPNTRNNIDLFDEYSLRNLFISYGLDFFEDLTVNYQRRILKNINKLLQYKGTEQVMVEILEIFGFTNTEVFKYYLTKNYEIDGDTGLKDYNQPKLEFYGVPINSNNLDRDLITYPSIDYETMVANDPYWKATKEEILQKDFNFLPTKYITLESVMDLLKETLDLSYFYNTVMYANNAKNNTNFSSYSVLDGLLFYNNKISSSGIKIFDALIAIQIMIVKKLGYTDRVITEPESIDYVYGYNFDNIVDNLNYYATTLPSSKLEELGFILENEVNEFQVPTEYLEDFEVGLNQTGLIKFQDFLSGTTIDINQTNFLNMYINNGKYRKAFEELLLEIPDYKFYKMTEKLMQTKFTVEFQREQFKYLDPDTEEYTYYTYYSDYLNDNNLDLLRYITPAEGSSTEDKNSFYVENITELCNSLDIYLDDINVNIFLNNNLFVGDYIKEYLKKVINIFKAYTIDLNNISIIYKFDNKYHNTIRLFEADIKFSKHRDSVVYQIEDNGEFNILQTNYLEFLENLNNIHDSFTITVIE